jgi:hypothetical protein
VVRALRDGNHAVTWQGQVKQQNWSWLHVVGSERLLDEHRQRGQRGPVSAVCQQCVFVAVRD